MSVELTTGSAFARYRIEELVGRGGMGVVYRATDLRLERPVALKLIAPELAGDERFRSRFLRESRIAASIDHPNVIPIYEADEEDGQLFLAMRYVDGTDLKALLDQEGTLVPERALTLLGQVAAALDAAHGRGLVHRDVKPGNVLLDGRDHAYLTDFGLTKQLGGASTETGQVVGTFAYLAPEQIRGEAVEARTDCYALACVLYECLAGLPAFRRETEAETLWAHMQEEPPAIPDYPALAPVWEKALAKTTEERYATCRDLIDAAREALRTGRGRCGDDHVHGRRRIDCPHDAPRRRCGEGADRRAAPDRPRGSRSTRRPRHRLDRRRVHGRLRLDAARIAVRPFGPGADAGTRARRSGARAAFAYRPQRGRGPRACGPSVRGRGQRGAAHHRCR
jgi:serine/threonine protein kinase